MARVPNFMNRKLQLGAFVALLAAATSGVACAADTPLPGFYGGISIRENGAEQGVAIGEAGNAGRFGSSLVDAGASQALVFGGYRWRNDLALEAALGSANGYRLPGRGGVGLALPPRSDEAGRAWNLDVYGSWTFARRFSLFGRLGYAQSDPTSLYSTSVVGAATDRRQRDGVSYGVGLRYDINRSLGLQLEYARIAAHAADAGSLALPDGDQVQFGLQFRF
jgi:opacity protein-like surface antigen